MSHEVIRPKMKRLEWVKKLEVETCSGPKKFSIIQGTKFIDLKE